MPRPRILLLPYTTEIEWPIRPRLEEWADVATFDAPGVGDGTPVEEVGPHVLAPRALKELDRRGWPDCVVAADEFAAVAAVALAARAPDRVAGLALGHPVMRYETDGPAPSIHGEVMSVFVQLSRLDYRSYLRGLTQLTQGAYDDGYVDEYIRRVPREVDTAYTGAIPEIMQERVGDRLRELGKPLLLVEHEGCLAFSKEGWDEMVAAFPEAATASTEVKPSTSAEFADALREFCAGLEFAPAS